MDSNFFMAGSLGLVPVDISTIRGFEGRVLDKNDASRSQQNVTNVTHKKERVFNLTL